ncbi:MAG: Rieske (2Fe-2S) protein [Alphaproteobacteria bacterium]
MAFAAIPDPGGVSVELGSGAGRLDIVVIRRAGAVHAYVNSCPHQGTPLEMFPNRFFTSDGKRLLCTTHGAQFDIATGRCLAGPCKGAGLTRVAVHVVEGWIVSGSGAG